MEIVCVSRCRATPPPLIGHRRHVVLTSSARRLRRPESNHARDGTPAHRALSMSHMGHGLPCRRPASDGRSPFHCGRSMPRARGSAARPPLPDQNERQTARKHRAICGNCLYRASWTRRRQKVSPSHRPGNAAAGVRGAAHRSKGTNSALPPPHGYGGAVRQRGRCGPASHFQLEVPPNVRVTVSGGRGPCRPGRGTMLLCFVCYLPAGGLARCI
jgi:hypothetical protein